MLSLLVGRDRLADTNSILILVSTCSLHAICVIPFDRCGPWMHTFQIDQIRWRAARRARDLRNYHGATQSLISHLYQTAKCDDVTQLQPDQAVVQDILP